MNRHIYRIPLFILMIISCTVSPIVGPVVPGQSLWFVLKMIGATVDIIESKVCLVDSQLDVVESKVDELMTTQQLFSVGDSLSSKLAALDRSMGDVVVSGLDEVQERLCSKLELLESAVEVVSSKFDLFG